VALGGAGGLHPPGQIVECVPNFSEGRDPAVLAAILQAMQAPEVRLLDWSRDPDHNRSVVTVAGPPEEVRRSVVQGALAAAERIDLRSARGVHPRIGAADVIPFVPLSGVTLGDCAALAHQAGQELWERAGVPVYFYEAAALRPDRCLLENVRRGQFEGLREAALTDPARAPDLGGPGLHPSAGASAVGARPFLLAYNLFLDTAELAAARHIARLVRAANGGLPGVKALGLLVDGVAQVSVNITRMDQVSPAQVHAAVAQAAAALGVRVDRGELIGLLPERAYTPGAAWIEQIPGFDPERSVLERRLRHPLPWPTHLP
jgi:glutamate formiminotransferase / 5-formyltetrahydrofolate cyclo-ligase